MKTENIKSTKYQILILILKILFLQHFLSLLIFNLIFSQHTVLSVSFTALAQREILFVRNGHYS